MTSQANGSNPYPNPALRTVNLYPYIAGNASSVWIRFSWTTNYPNSATDPNVWITYGWLIDDVQLSATPSFVMENIEANHGGWYTTPISQGFGMQYKMKPLIQSAANPYKFEIMTTNIDAKSIVNS